MQIKSNTFGKLMKIREGTVFSSEYMFIKEFLQNTQRGKSKNVYITVEEDVILFEDDGLGCKNPESVFTLDKSDWITTDEGFGIGFWSCLALKKLKEIEVKSRKWKSSLNVEKLFLTEDLTVDKEDLIESIRGFSVKLKCSHLTHFEIEDIKEEIISISQYLNLNTFINGEYVEKVDIFENVEGEFVKEIENRFFKAKLTIAESFYNRIQIFYDRRKVSELYRFNYVSGIIEPKKGKLTLKEPDRTDYVRDSKYYDFEEVLYKEIRKLYIDFLKTQPNDDMLTKYSDGIDEYLEVKDYSKFLIWDNEEILNTTNNTDDKKQIDSSIKPAVNIDKKEITYIGMNSQDEENINLLESVLPTESVDSIQQLSYSEEDYVDYSNDESISDTVALTYETNTEEDQIVFDREQYIINDYTVVQSTMNRFANEIHNKNNEKSIIQPKKENSFVSFIKNKKNLVWVEKKYADEYGDEISLAQYCNLYVYKSKNILESNTLKEYNKLHISDLKDSLIETHNTKNVGLKNKKEECFIKLLMPICEKYGLHINIFSIANLSLKTELKIHDKVVYKKNEVNSKKHVYIGAVCSGNTILFDRNYLGLSRFSIKEGKIACSEISLIMSVAKTVAHELAHYLYDTVDNTLNHYKIENDIHNEIVQMYVHDKQFVIDTIKKYS